MNSMRVLIVEAEPYMAEAICDGLRRVWSTRPG
jgi:hypothetical protein